MSDWALGKKMNSQIADVPLNHLIWLNDYKTYGEDSYVFQNKDILHELYASPIAANDRGIFSEALSWIIEQNEQVGSWLSKRYSIKADLKSLETIEDVSSNLDAVTSIVAETEVLDAIFQSCSADVFLHGIYKNGFQKTNNDIITGLRAANTSGLETKLSASSLFDSVTTTFISSSTSMTFMEDCTDSISYVSSVHNQSTSSNQGVICYNYDANYTYKETRCAASGSANANVFVWDGLKVGTTWYPVRFYYSIHTPK